MDIGKCGIGHAEVKIECKDFNEGNEAFQIVAVKNEPSENYVFINGISSSSSSETDFVEHKHATNSYLEHEHNEEKLVAKNYSKFFDNLSNTCDSVRIKDEDIDIFYEDIKRETGEEKPIENSGLQPLEVQDEGAKEEDSSAIPQRLSVPPMEIDNELKRTFCPEPLKNNVSASEKKYQCKSCSKSFSHAGNLKIHERSHTGEKPFHCKFCSKSFVQQGTLTIHERVHTGEKPFHCKFCSNSFSQKTVLKAHEMVHTGEKPFHCQICYKSFRHKSGLNNHERIHLGENPFLCKVCSEAFTSSSDLTVHGRVHTGEKPFHCKMCSKLYAKMGSLRNHESRCITDEKFEKYVQSLTFKRLVQ